jgi:2-polyprenyl-6-methoxyphenol hydroxylase-like FAD-dependent oxidoreductase
MAGSTLACLLADRGIDVVVLEQEDDPRSLSPMPDDRAGDEASSCDHAARGPHLAVVDLAAAGAALTVRGLRQ